MAEAFDPYHRWLGISPKEQPPHHYRLLAIEPFEDSPEVIEAAADQRMAHLRNYQAGEHSALSQKLLNEVSAARICLLNPHKKADYDRKLRQQLDANRKVIPRAEPLDSGEQDKPVDSSLAKLFEKTAGGADFAKAGIARDRKETQVTVGVAIGLVGLIAAVGIILWIASSSPETALSLDWPAAEREDAAVQIDDKRFEVRPSGKLEFPLEPGFHRVTAFRRGHACYEKEFTLPKGKTLTLQPEWRKLAEKRPKETPKPAPAEAKPHPVTPKPPAKPDPAPGPAKRLLRDSGQWIVIFRSADPAIWNSDVTDGPDRFAISLSRVPEGIKYLRMQIDAERFVIVEVTKDKLGKRVESGQIGWVGNNHFQWNGRHLGIYDKRWTDQIRGTVQIWPMQNRGIRGWGFGNRTQIDDRQGYSWAGEGLPKTVFEIAVKSAELTAAERKALLK